MLERENIDAVLSPHRVSVCVRVCLCVNVFNKLDDLCSGVCVCECVCMYNKYLLQISLHYLLILQDTAVWRGERFLNDTGSFHSHSHANPSFQWLPADLITCTFVAFWGLCFAFYCVDSLNLYIVKEKKVLTVYQNGILRNCSYSRYIVQFRVLSSCEGCPNVCI